MGITFGPFFSIAVVFFVVQVKSSIVKWIRKNIRILPVQAGPIFPRPSKIIPGAGTLKLNPRLLLGGIAIVAFATGRILYQGVPYLAGKHGSESFFQLYEYTWMLLVFFSFGVSLFASIGLGALLLSRFFLDKKERKKTLWESLFLTVVIFATWKVCLGTSQSAHQYFLTGFKEFVSEQESLPAIRHWSSGLNIQEGSVSEKEWPQFVLALGPSSVSVENNGGNREVSLNWGGGFSRWGLTLRSIPNGPPHRTGQEIRVIDASTYVWADSR